MYTEILDQLKQNKIVAVIRKIPKTIFSNVITALVDGGIHAIEVTMDAEEATHEIRQLNDIYGDQVLVGAGTIFTQDQLNSAVEAGVKFLVSPHLDNRLLEKTNELQRVYIPGVLTPSEIQLAREHGTKMFKIFPANAVGSNFVKDILGPFSGLQIMVTGGLNEKNAKEFVRAGASVVGLGSALFPRQDVEEQNWNAIKERAQRLIEELNS
jgi:2-dehydro-3-deoxyphosphogluconate aldolase/(4S)-4-hydroxy-2-oxoglutarate aldolase